MPTICPTITATTIDEYNMQMKEVAPFITRVHIDLADGVFAPTKLIDIKDVWWPAGIQADIHVMYQAITPYIKDLIALQPQLVVVHAEAAGTFSKISHTLQKHGIKVGVALLAETQVDIIRPVLKSIDHVLIFSGDLGYFGGHAKMDLLSKIREIKKINTTVEIGWDGGINTENIRKLVLGGVDVLNVGGSIHKTKDPRIAYDTLKALASN